MSKKRIAISVSIVVASVLASTPFVGFDQYVGDHEVGTSWDLFIKSKPTLRMLFKNPEQYALDFDPYETLGKDKQREFIEYCEIRWGASDPHVCEKIVQDHRI